MKDEPGGDRRVSLRPDGHPSSRLLINLRLLIGKTLPVKQHPRLAATICVQSREPLVLACCAWLQGRMVRSVSVIAHGPLCQGASIGTRLGAKIHRA